MAATTTKSPSTFHDFDSPTTFLNFQVNSPNGLRIIPQNIPVEGRRVESVKPRISKIPKCCWLNICSRHYCSDQGIEVLDQVHGEVYETCEGFWPRKTIPHSIAIYKSAPSLLWHEQFNPEILPKFRLEFLLFTLDKELLCFTAIKRYLHIRLLNYHIVSKI